MFKRIVLLRKDININMKKIIIGLLALLMIFAFAGCDEQQADVVSRNLSQQANNFNIARKLTVINQRTDTILFQITGNFSIDVDKDGDLAIVGESPDGKYYKHYVHIGTEVVYVMEDLGETGVSKYHYEINFNPKMIFGKVVDKPVIID